MASLGNLVNRKPLKTSAQLRSIIGKPGSPCPKCGSPGFGVEATGDLRCLGCLCGDDYQRLRFPLRVFLIVDGDGNAIWADLDDLKASRELTEAMMARTMAMSTDHRDEMDDDPSSRSSSAMSMRVDGNLIDWTNPDGSRVICRRGHEGDGPPPGVSFDAWWERQREMPAIGPTGNVTPTLRSQSHVSTVRPTNSSASSWMGKTPPKRTSKPRAIKAKSPPKPSAKATAKAATRAMFG